MAFLLKIKKHNKIYAYNCISYWDKNKQQSRQKREYLGIWDEKRNVLIPKSPRDIIQISTSKSFGDCYFFKKIVEQLKLEKLLKKHFKNSNEILTLCFSKIKNCSSFNLSPVFLSDTCIDDILNINLLKSQKISNLLESLSEDKSSFFEDWIKLNKSDNYFYDITSFSSYSEQINELEYGYNRDKINLPQINFGMIVSKKNKLPIYYKKYSGSICDVSTIKNIIIDLNSLGIENPNLVLDLGFYSELNLKLMHNANFDFTIPLLKSTKIYRNLIKENFSNILEIDNSFICNDKTYFGIEKKIIINNIELFAYIFSNETKRGLEIDSFIKKLDEILNNIDKSVITQKLIDEKKISEAFPTGYQSYSKYFDIVLNNHEIIITKNKSKIEEQINLLGKFILLSKNKREKYEIINTYRDKDSIEKDYNIIKNYINGVPLKVHKIETLEGLLFILFLTTIIKREILNKLKQLKDNKKIKKLSSEELFLELSKIKKVIINENEYITEISKKQREIFDLFNFEIPS
jgi:transposase